MISFGFTSVTKRSQTKANMNYYCWHQSKYYSKHFQVLLKSVVLENIELNLKETVLGMVQALEDTNWKYFRNLYFYISSLSVSNERCFFSDLRYFATKKFVGCNNVPIFPSQWFSNI